MRVLWLYTIQPDSGIAYAADIICSSPTGIEKLGNEKVESTSIMVIAMPGWRTVVKYLPIYVVNFFLILFIGSVYLIFFYIISVMHTHK